MNLRTKISKLERATEPLRARQEKVRQWIEEGFAQGIEDYVQGLNYMYGQVDRREEERSFREYLTELCEEMGRRSPRTRAEIDEINCELAIKGRRRLGQELTPEEHAKEQELYGEVEADRKAGVPSDQSEAFKRFRELMNRNSGRMPRNVPKCP